MSAVARFAYAKDLRRVRLARSGAASHFDELYAEYKDFIRVLAKDYFIVGADHDDVLQEAMVGFYKAVRDYDGVSSSFRSFVRLCATRQMITAVVTATRTKHESLNSAVRFESAPQHLARDSGDAVMLLDAIPAPGEDLLQHIANRDKLATLLQILRFELTELEYNAFQLWLAGITYADIGRKLKVSAKAVDNALTRVQRKLTKVNRLEGPYKPEVKYVQRSEKRSIMTVPTVPTQPDETSTSRRRQAAEFARQSTVLCNAIAAGKITHCELTRGSTTMAHVVPASSYEGVEPRHTVPLEDLRNYQKVQEFIRTARCGSPISVTQEEAPLVVIVSSESAKTKVPAQPLALVEPAPPTPEPGEAAEAEELELEVRLEQFDVANLTEKLGQKQLSRKRLGFFYKILLVLEGRGGEVGDPLGRAVGKLHALLPPGKSRATLSVDLNDLEELGIIKQDKGAKKTDSITLTHRLSPSLIEWLRERTDERVAVPLLEVPSEPEPEAPLKPVSETTPNVDYQAQAAEAMQKAEIELSKGYESRAQLLADFADRYLRLAELSSSSTG